MLPNADDRATRLLNRLHGGDVQVSEELLELIYGELHKLAAAHMSAEAPHHTLQPTALVHEAYLRLIRQDGASWQSRGHFFAMASKIMRSLLVDHARRKGSKKRGGDHVRVALEDRHDDLDPVESPEVNILDLNEALEELGAVDPDRAQIVELRFFGGLTAREVAHVLGVPQRTIERRWRVASAWLRDRLDA